MNAAQQRLYFRLWAPVREQLRARGLSSAQCEEQRHAIHVKALGKPKSSGDFTNADFDKVKAAFLAAARPDDLNAQLDVQESPQRRRAALEARIFAAGEKFISGDNEDHRQWRTIAYANQICKNLGFPANWPMADLTQLAKVMGIIERRAKQVAGKKGQNLASQNSASQDPY